MIGPISSPTDPISLAASLAPALADACDARLSPITWFKADWQRGGAATGRATWRSGDETVSVLVKLPVVQRELLWIGRLQSERDPVVPRLFATGQTLGGHDLAWMVAEWLPFGPLGTHWHPDHTARTAEAAARFYAAASAYPVDQKPRAEPWDELLRHAQQSLKVNDVPQRQRWNSGIKAIRTRLDRIVDQWESRDAAQWVHGDLHLANAMSRVSLEAGPVCLIDLAEVRAGHWVEDAVYFERQLWARPERLRAAQPVKAIAEARKARGLPVEKNYPRLALIRRALLAATAPGFLKSEGNPRHLEACLDWLKTAAAELK